MLHFSPTSFQDAKLINGQAYSSYQLAAYAAGIITDQREALEAFQQVYTLSTAYELRGLFATLTLDHYPTMPILEQERFRDAMMDDYIRRGDGPDEAYNNLLLEIQRLLKLEDKTMEFFHLPVPQGSTTELEIEILRYTPRQQLELYDRLNTMFPDNEQHQAIHNFVIDWFDRVEQYHHMDNMTVIVVDGPGGTGKTVLFQKLLAYSRAHRKIAKATASITLAANLYHNGSTTHSHFKYPVVEDYEIDIEEQEKIAHTLNP